jgi:long-chain acyl-CoA synthetase
MSLNIADCVDLTAHENPDKLAIISDTLRMSYSELAMAAKRVANALSERGVGRGDVVGLMLPNTPHFPITYFGALYAGATVLAMNPTMRAHEIAHQLEETEAKALFAWHDCAAQAALALEGAPACRHLIIVEPTLVPVIPPKGESFIRFLAEASPEFDIVDTNPDDTAAIIYTSVLGGHTYGAELTHFNLLSNASAIREQFGYGPADVLLAVLPLFHLFGQMTMMLVPFVAQSAVVMVSRFDAPKLADIIARERVTMVCLVPTMLQLFLNVKPDHPVDFSSIRCVTVGGSMLRPELARTFAERFNVIVVEGYGLTETSPVVSFNIPETNRIGSIGKPLWGSRVQIQREDGAFAAPREVGEIVVRGHNVMKGYLKHPEATAKAMEGGWLHTGDWGYLDEDGFLYITGLKKDILIRAGLNVYCYEIEQVLEQHPAVQEAAVVGLPDPLRGEEPKAFLVPKPGMTIDQKDIAAYCREELASYRCPRSFEMLNALPRDAAGHIDKAALRARDKK